MIPETPGRRKKRRLAVEVYFVLYLSAIILLLGTSPAEQRYDAQLESAIAELIDTDFEIDVQKIALIVPFMPAGMESDSLAGLLPRDTMNVIRAHGAFSSVEFRIVAIEDTSTGSSLPAERAYLERETDSSVTFHWRHENESQTAVYQVTIEAEAIPTIPENISSPDIRSRIQEVIAERGLMRDTAQFSINVIPATSQEYLLAVRSAPTLGGNEGEIDTGISALQELLTALARNGGTTGSGFRVNPEQYVITVPRGGTWENTVQVWDAQTSELRISGDPTVNISSRTATSLTLVGPAPANGGEKEVKVTIIKGNNEQGIVSFRVRTTQLEAPSIPGTMYAGETYTLDFTSNGIDTRRISIAVSENGRTVLENQPARLTYTPRTASGSIIFSRYIDGKLVDSKSADASPLSNPNIRMVRFGDEEAVVEVLAYGTVNGRPNRPILQVS